MATVLFKKTKKLEMKTDEFLDMVSQSGIAFKEAIRLYLKTNQSQFEDHFVNVKHLENRADILRKEIEEQLYSETLIPESRGDVLALLENTDNVINSAKETLLRFSIEQPEVDEKFHADYLQLTDFAVSAMEEMVSAIRAFLRDPMGVRDYLHKVYYYEKEADKIGEHLKRQIFKSKGLELSEKFHLRYFVESIDNLADGSESVADRLAIYTIKRSV